MGKRASSARQCGVDRASQGLLSSLCGAPDDAWVCRPGRATHRNTYGKILLKRHAAHDCDWVWSPHSPLTGRVEHALLPCS